MADRDLQNREPQQPVTPYEARDVNVKAITRFGIGFVLVLIAVIFGVWGLFAFYESYFGGQALPSQYVNVDARKLPPEPRLQAAPQLDLQAMRAAEDQILNHYAWVDPDKGTVRIPIARAIDIMAQRGFPFRKTAEPVSSTSPLTAAPTESGTGPVLQQVGGPLAPVIHIPPVQPEVIRGDGSFADGRQAGGPPTPLQDSPGVPTWGQAQAAPGAAGTIQGTKK